MFELGFDLFDSIIDNRTFLLSPNDWLYKDGNIKPPVWPADVNGEKYIVLSSAANESVYDVKK